VGEGYHMLSYIILLYHLLFYTGFTMAIGT